MLNLDEKYVAIIKEFLAEHVPTQIVWAYGSRIKGKSHEGSDLDLVIISAEDEVTQKQLSALREALSESMLPILVDVLDWNTIPQEFKQEIEKEHFILQDPYNIRSKRF